MNVKDITTRDFWRAFAPKLHIEDQTFLKDFSLANVNPQQQPILMSQIKEEGYLQGSIEWGLDVNVMTERVRALSEIGLSPVFAFIYDEFWIPFFKLHRLYSGLLGGKYYLLPDFWVWNVDPK